LAQSYLLDLGVDRCGGYAVDGRSPQRSKECRRRNPRCNWRPGIQPLPLAGHIRSITSLTRPRPQKWSTGQVRPEQGLLKLRKEMQTFGNLRPCNFAAESLVEISPLKAEVCRGVDFNIIRELTGGIYFGDRKEDDGDGIAWDTEPYSRPEVERITRLAAHLALQHDPPLPVWSLDKANVLATSRLWRNVVTEVMQNEFPQLKIGHQLIDSAAMLMVKNPRALNGIVVTSNLFGDIISDEASVIPGSLGLLPSASLTGIPDGITKVNGIYEPIHGNHILSRLQPQVKG
jgi:3-isopropylmalate dehydrogenase